MSVLLIAGCGIAIVLLSILVFKLHPLMGLLLGSLFLLTATPEQIKLSNQLQDGSSTIVATDESDLIGFKDLLADGDYLVWFGEFSEDALATITLELVPKTAEPKPNSSDAESDRVYWYRVLDASAQLSVKSQVVPIAALSRAKQQVWSGLGSRLADGFTKTFRRLGIPVTMAAIVGVCLLESGAAAKLVNAIIQLFGTRSTAPALTFSGFFLGVPVFFDNVFYLLLPLAKAVGRKQPEKFLSAVMAIIVGATMAHSLVPPTPGPLLVASLMKVSVGTMMVGGLVVGGAAAVVGFWYGMICDRWVKFDSSKLIQSASNSETVVEQERPAPPLWLAALPIVLPICALGGSEILKYLAESSSDSSRIFYKSVSEHLSFANDPALIFLLTAVIAIAMLRFYADRLTVSNSIARGISDAGTIVLLTCAGGSFGASLQQLQLAEAIGGQFHDLTTPWGILITAFLLTTIVRAAQGSATVAMITSAAIVSPVMSDVQLPFHPLYVALAIGCGSKPLPWMNDSGFWQVTTMTGMTPVQTLKSFSVALTLMGITGFGITLLGAWLLPLASAP